MFFVGKDLRHELDNNYNAIDIFNYYVPDASTISNCKSPLRKDDDTPSFRLYWMQNILFFHDFGSGEMGDVYKFVRLLYNISYKEALVKIYKDLNNIPNKLESKSTSKIDYGKVKSIVKYRPRKPNDDDFSFWFKYLMDLHTLNKFFVYPIKAYSINQYTFLAEKCTYAIKIGSRVKIYQPGRVPKYLGNTNKNSIQGWHMLDKQEVIYIVSSLKEVMVLYEYGITAIAPNSESSKIDNEIIEMIKTIPNSDKKRKLIILYDWDDAGRKNAKLHADLYGAEISKLQNNKYQKKDLSDYAELSRDDFFQEIILKIKSEKAKFLS